MSRKEIEELVENSMTRFQKVEVQEDEQENQNDYSNSLIRSSSNGSGDISPRSRDAFDRAINNKKSS